MEECYNMKIEQLENNIKDALQRRLATTDNYSVEEINRLSQKSCRLFPNDFAIDETLCNELRAMCQLSQVSLRPAPKITSHRRFIGPLIVAIKKMTYPFIKIHLEHTINGVAEFNSWTVQAYARQALKLRELEQTLKKL